jgi:hypothetical protein
MSAPIGESPNTEVNLGAARIALASLWCAALAGHEVFSLPRYCIVESPHVLTAAAAAQVLRSRVNDPKPLRISPAEWDGEALSVITASVEPDDSPAAGFGGWVDPTSRALLLGGGRGLRVSGAMLRQFDARYRVAAPASASGSPPNDPWTHNLQLPPTWLEGVEFVILLGRQEGNTSSHPVRAASGFDPALVDDLY